MNLVIENNAVVSSVFIEGLRVFIEDMEDDASDKDIVS